VTERWRSKGIWQTWEFSSLGRESRDVSRPVFLVSVLALSLGVLVLVSGASTQGGGNGARCTMAKNGGNVMIMMLLLVSVIIYYYIN